MNAKENAVCQKKPQIDKNSEKMAERLFKEISDPPHIRLFKKKEKNLIKKERNIKTNKLKMNVVELPKTKSRIKVENRSIATLYNDAKQKEERLKMLKTKIETGGFHAELPTAGENSNKFMLKKFLTQYNDALHAIVPKDNVEKINLYQLNQFFEALKLVSPPEDPSKKITTPKKESEFNPNLAENSLRQQEKNLITQVWENLKDEEGSVNTNHLFLFLLAILNLYESYLYTSYKKAHKSELNLKTEESPLNTKENNFVLTEGSITKFNNTSSPNANIKTQGSRSANKTSAIKSKTDKNSKITSGKLDKSPRRENEALEKEQILSRISADINNKIKVSKKYCSFDNDNAFILSFSNAKLINHDFCLFYVNWSSYEYNVAKLMRKEDTQGKLNTMPFKPTIDQKSAKMFMGFRRKIQNDNANNPHLDNMNYIEMLVLKKKKQEK